MTQQFPPVHSANVVVATADGHVRSNVVYHPVVLPPNLWPHNFLYCSLLMLIYMAIFYLPLICLPIPAFILAVRVSSYIIGGGFIYVVKW